MKDIAIPIHCYLAHPFVMRCTDFTCAKYMNERKTMENARKN